MGCKLSKEINVSDRTTYLDKRNDTINASDSKINHLKNNEESNSSPILSDEQKTLIANTWQLLVENVSKVGVITFMRYSIRKVF